MARSEQFLSDGGADEACGADALGSFDEYSSRSPRPKGMKSPSPMQYSRLLALASLGLALSALSACSSSTDGGPAGSAGATGNCTAPVLSGSPFGSMGSASITGTGTLPDGIANGLELQVLLDQGNLSVGVLPDDLLNSNDRVCGKTFQYDVHKIAAGTYTLTFEVTDPNSNDFTTLFAGTAPSSFTVTDGQALMQNTTFQLTTK